MCGEHLLFLERGHYDIVALVIHNPRSLQAAPLESLAALHGKVERAESLYRLVEHVTLSYLKLRFRGGQLFLRAVAHLPYALAIPHNRQCLHRSHFP